MSSAAHPLTFAVVDGLAFAASRGTLDNANRSAPFQAASLGPVLEFIDLMACGALPPGANGEWLAPDEMSPFVEALLDVGEVWLSPGDGRMGFMRSRQGSPQSHEDQVNFLMHAKRAARLITGLPDSTAGQLVAAMEEFEGNIQEHSESVESGLLAYHAAGNVFEFVALDKGIGVLDSLRRCGTFADLASHGKALQMALTDGVSRFGLDSKRGHGFRPMFVGLANLRGSLRFRSGDCALTMDGTSPTLATAHLAQKVYLKGLFISASCFAV